MPPGPGSRSNRNSDIPEAIQRHEVERDRDMPNPWLFDSAQLRTELERVRGLILAIPLHTNTYLPTHTAVDALWRLESTLRWLLNNRPAS
jgi:hypothetical protein